jgi:hypothetical protein
MFWHLEAQLDPCWSVALKVARGVGFFVAVASGFRLGYVQSSVRDRQLWWPTGAALSFLQRREPFSFYSCGVRAKHTPNSRQRVCTTWGILM